MATPRASLSIASSLSSIISVPNPSNINSGAYGLMISSLSRSTDGDSPCLLSSGTDGVESTYSTGVDDEIRCYASISGVASANDMPGVSYIYESLLFLERSHELSLREVSNI